MKMMMVITIMFRVLISGQCICKTNCRGLNIQGSLQVCGLQRASEVLMLCNFFNTARTFCMYFVLLLLEGFKHMKAATLKICSNENVSCGVRWKVRIFTFCIHHFNVQLVTGEALLYILMYFQKAYWHKRELRIRVM